MFNGELDVTNESELEKSQAKQYRDYLLEIAATEGKMIERMRLIRKGMEVFCHSKKKMFLPTREGITDALEEIRRLRYGNSSHETFIQ